MHETECSGLVHWDDPEGWDAEGGGRGVQDGEHMYTHGWFMSMYGKTTEDGDCSHEIKRYLLLGRKAMTNLDSILKSRDITLPTKVHLVKAIVFPVVMYGCESWTIKKAEHRRIDAFELWCWRRLLRVPWLQGDPTSLCSQTVLLWVINSIGPIQFLFIILSFQRWSN